MSPVETWGYKGAVDLTLSLSLLHSSHLFAVQTTTRTVHYQPPLFTLFPYLICLFFSPTAYALLVLRLLHSQRRRYYG